MITQHDTKRIVSCFLRSNTYLSICPDVEASGSDSLATLKFPSEAFAWKWNCFSRYIFISRVQY